MKNTKKPSLFTAIALSVGTMLGSGWLYASYYASQATGASSIFSWIIGAFVVLLMAFLLSELAVKYPTNGLFTRLVTISHNQHFGFVTGLSNWMLGLIIVPSEAMATTQYISSIYEPITPYVFSNGELTFVGVLVVAVFMLLYTLINYWGIKSLSKINNSLTSLKIIIPIATSVIIMIAAFHSSNFGGENVKFMPDGVSGIFNAIVTCGIFYSFFGFQMAASFSAELDNPRKNIPIALVSSVLIVLFIYLLLQISFIGGVPEKMLENGWGGLNFESPLAQLTGILGLNALALVLYADALISPSGTGIIYLGASTRMLNEMSKAKQMPGYFARVTEGVNVSRTSLIFSFICSLILIFFFRNWQMIASLTTTFILVSCIALPIAYAKIKANKADPLPLSYLPFSRTIAFLVYMFLTYLLMIAGVLNLVVALVLHIVFFLIYAYIDSKGDFSKITKAFASSWVIFAYLVSELVFGYIYENISSYNLFTLVFVVISAVLYVLLINQKSYTNIKN
ncbi:APC family permease [Francisella philomiragia]|uniref:Tryptophan/tyrosine permease family protein n=1 Tax=Francisella philomiragia TaxID=28110 RepID=A0AAW3D814_9GAMM|nr:APC family permease [Francisella philomiragia]KFJ42111.1 tryptophan/tyrosine permease family protein [Francisella philomiragia]MBK2254024.1 APC family permease [Francisella philomiragia]MBK2272336.1 APC family permease [Francisella philomiragia]MBK2276178.1 APC family permease [Francisella philomiragia]MBK2280125.1 APC family permease [Francisella philomiragia]